MSDVIESSLRYALTYYNTVDGNMYKEWMNEKRTKKDFASRTMMKREYGYFFWTERMKRKWNH